MGSIPLDDDIILDFFSGSATTAHAVMQLNFEDGGNRKFIMVQLPEVTDEKSEAYKAGYHNICEIGKERIRRAGTKIEQENNKLKNVTVLENKTDVNLFTAIAEQGRDELDRAKEKCLFETVDASKTLDLGFKVLKLDSSNLAKWDNTPIESNDLGVLFERFDSITETIKKDRSDLDVVYEVMLKMGVPLAYKIVQTKINGKKAYSIGEECLLLVCLDGGKKGITPEDIEAMCELAPAKIIASEEAFADDTALSNAHYILKDRNIEMKLL
jgi:adenine-specific DNA-methyltransferase